MALPEALTRDAVFVAAIARTLMLTHNVDSDAQLTIADWVGRHARNTPNAPVILQGARTVSYAELDAGANRFARWAASQKLAKGEPVALLLDNCPEYVMAWLGLIKNGSVAALINTNLQSQALAHSINISGAKHLILGQELIQNYASCYSGLQIHPTVWGMGGSQPGNEDLDAALVAQSSGPLDPATRVPVFCRDPAMYIYTSGTTGLPKAAQLSHMRVLHIMMAFQGAVNAKPHDRMYDVLPLYHSAGGICALGPVLLPGASMVIRTKFSATEFWDDCAKYKPTLFQYIGELCRYLLNTPPHPLERSHNLDIAIGNGLRPEIWPRFQERFRIPHIMEFYGATEGNVGMISYDGHVGAIGRVPWYARSIQKVRLVRYDVEKQIPVRRSDGFCIETDNGEAGEAVGEINQHVARERFDGYTKKEDTEKKILHDVFKKGDAWFRTGDLMRRDKHGYFYFVDRTGDTFRWKGENVATSEVAEALSSFPGVREANVYGVPVPGEEGKAGMAALVADPSLDLGGLAAHLQKALPSYARPVFLRFQKEIAATSTFKQTKVGLQAEGYDPSKISDPLYVRDSAGAYAPLTPERYAQIQKGETKL
jgi:fatty-acyl-CoA synthase